MIWPNNSLSIIGYRCLGYRTHRPAEEQDPSAGDPRGEVPPSRGQNCGHEERKDHRGGNLPSALGPGQGVRGFSHPVHTGIYIEQEKNEDANSFFVVLGTSLTRAPHGHNGYLLSFYSLSVADRGIAYIATPVEGTYVCHRQKLGLLLIQHPDTNRLGYVGKCWRFYVCSMD
jgi:hypothetical protein